MRRSQGKENSLKTETLWKGKEAGRAGQWPEPKYLIVPGAFVEKTTLSPLNCHGTIFFLLYN